MNYNSIFEESSALKDVAYTIMDGIQIGVGNFKSNHSGISRASSLSSATTGLNLVFPVLISKSLPLETAVMISRAVERKATTLLQIAFSAFNITNSRDATEFIQNFHTNVKGKMDIDKFINIMDTYSESNDLIPPENMGTFKSVLEDLRKVASYYPEDINESSINDYKIKETRSGLTVLKEADSTSDPTENQKFARQMKQDDIKNRQFGLAHGLNVKNSNRKYDFDQKNAERMKARDNVQNTKDSIDIIRNQLLSTDVKKANEMIPTMIIVNFVTIEKDQQVTRQIVLGVKAKLIDVDPQDVINKIITKNVDNNVLLKFVRATTKEISFMKDFLFAIDNAKLSATNKKSQTNRILKVLERRAIGGKIRKVMGKNNAYKAISTLVISKEEANQIMSSHNIDVMSNRVMNPIMEQLSLMMFMVADESSESVSILMDTGDDSYETISYTHLEREASDGASKKAINLMTKLSR